MEVARLKSWELLRSIQILNWHQLKKKAEVNLTEMDNGTASFKLRPRAKPNNSCIHQVGNWRVGEQEGRGCLFFLTRLKTDVTKAHWKFLLPCLSIYLNFKPGNLDLNVTKKKKVFGWIGKWKKKGGGMFLTTLILPAADMLTTIFILVNVGKVKNITPASNISKPWICFLKYIYVTNAIHKKIRWLCQSWQPHLPTEQTPPSPPGPED